MEAEELKGIIAKELAAGKDVTEIRKVLLSQGVETFVLDEAINEALFNAPSDSEIPAKPKEQPTPKKRELTPQEVLGETKAEPDYVPPKELGKDVINPMRQHRRRVIRNSVLIIICFLLLISLIYVGLNTWEKYSEDKAEKEAESEGSTVPGMRPLREVVLDAENMTIAALEELDASS